MRLNALGRGVLAVVLSLAFEPANAIPKWLAPDTVGARVGTDSSTAATDVFRATTGVGEYPILLAHAILVKAFPEREATVTDVPGEVLLIFNDAVGEEFLALAVVDESGKRIDNHDAKLDFTDHSHLRASIAKLSPGRYMVRYRVLSADGHVVSGKYFFQVQGK